MKKVCIITLFSNVNYGNRLQNYALQEAINKFGFNCETIINLDLRISKVIKSYCKSIVRPVSSKDKQRMKNFDDFNKLIRCNNKKVNNNNVNAKLKYDYYITGSDQVWNPQFCSKNKLKFNLLSFAPDKKRISYAASFGIREINKEDSQIFMNELSKFKKISVRENAGYKIIKNLNNKFNCEVVVDPTLLLSEKEWESIEIKPKNYNNEKYILNYFLGGQSDDTREMINEFAKKHKCKVIDLLNENEDFYICGPQEFIYLIRNAFLVCTDSFHASVFSFLFNKPFIVFERIHAGYLSMNSRIDSLLNTFDMNDRKFNGKKIEDKYLDYNYSKGYKELEKKREEGYKFLKDALDVEYKEDINE